MGDTASHEVPSLPFKSLQDYITLKWQGVRQQQVKRVASLHTMAVLQAYQADR